MTSQIYRVLLTHSKCPRCDRQYTEDDFIMWGDPKGWKLEDDGFHYSLRGNCKSCKLITSFEEIGIPQLNNMDEVERSYGIMDAKIKMLRLNRRQDRQQ